MVRKGLVGGGGIAAKVRHHGPESVASPAHGHLLLPASLPFSVTDRSVDKPAKPPGLEFPGRAMPPGQKGTLPNRPAGFGSCVFHSLMSKKPQSLSFHMCRYPSPPLFETLYRFVGDAEQIRHCALRFPQLAPDFRELFARQRSLLPSPGASWALWAPLPMPGLITMRLDPSFLPFPFHASQLDGFSP